MAEAGKKSSVLWRVVAAVIAAGVIGGTIAAFAEVMICDQQLTANGTVVSVCRHMQATDPPVIAAGLVLVVALGSFFGEISGFGFSLKKDVQAAQRAAEDAQEKAIEAKVATETFEETASDLAEGVQQALSGGRPVQPRPTDGSPREELDGLAEEYNHVRWTMSAGRERTTAMTLLAHKMVEQAKRLPDLDIANYLHTNNAGRRMVAYTFLYAHPEPVWTSELAEAVLKDDKPFNQYWALRALDAQQVVISTALDPELLRRLRERLPELQSDAGRYQLLTKLLQQKA